MHERSLPRFLGFLTVPLVLVLAGCVVPATEPMTGLTPLLEAADQDLRAGDRVLVIKRAVIDRPGWIEIHATTPDGKVDPASDLGKVFLEPGEHRDVQVTLNRALAGSRRVFAMLHYDDPADGEFTFAPGRPDDPPVRAGGKVVVRPLTVRGSRPLTPSLMVGDQDLKGNNDTITIASVAIDMPGWIEVHASTPEGKVDAASDLGKIFLVPGEYRGLSLKLKEPLKGQRRVFVMLHYDVPPDGRFTFAPGKADDPPVVVEKKVVVVPITARSTIPLAPALEVMDQALQDGALVVSRVAIDRPGWIEIHDATPDGKVDPATDLGKVFLAPGEYSDVRVPLEVEVMGERRVFAMLHYDDPADGEFTFAPGRPDDPPVRAEGKVVVRPVTVRAPAALPPPQEFPVFAMFNFDRVEGAMPVVMTGEQVVVEMQGVRFRPEVLRVSPGTTLIFRNLDPIPHTVTIPALGVDRQVGPGEEVRVTVEEPAVLKLVCTIHPPDMLGIITVAP